MSRGLASGITSQLASGKFSMAHLIAIETNESPYSPSDEAGNYLYTDAPVDIQNKLDATVEKFLYRLGTTEQSNIGTMSENTNMMLMVEQQILAMFSHLVLLLRQ